MEAHTRSLDEHTSCSSQGSCIGCATCDIVCIAAWKFVVSKTLQRCHSSHSFRSHLHFLLRQLSHATTLTVRSPIFASRASDPVHVSQKNKSRGIRTGTICGHGVSISTQTCKLDCPSETPGQVVYGQYLRGVAKAETLIA